MPPFQDEGAEPARKRQRPVPLNPETQAAGNSGPSRKKVSTPAPVRVLFQAEPEEMQLSSTSSRPVRKPFAPESADADSSSTESPCTCEPGVFNFGWHNIHTAAKVRFSQAAASAGQLPKKGRPYDNSKREARAAYARKGDHFKNNGQSAERIVAVLSSAECACYLVCSG